MKETEGYLEKERQHRDRSKKKRLTVDEKRELANDLKPKHQPYHRKKDWMQHPMVEDEEQYGVDEIDEYTFYPEVYDADYKEIP